MKRVLVSIFVSVVAMTHAFGCSRLPSRRYVIYMVNRTPYDLEGVSVYFNGRMAADKGTLVPGGLASFGPVTLPIPEEAEVRWIDEGKNPQPEPKIAGNDASSEAVARMGHWIDQGEPHAPKVKLRGVVPDNPVDVDIYFIIEKDASVTIKVVGMSDVDGGIAATKGIEKYRIQPH